MRFHDTYQNIISMENLLASWREFLRGKRKRKDVAEFQVHLFENITQLHNDLKNKTYQHSQYEAFKINDPKPRDIHKASVRDRLLHHAIYRVLYPYFDKQFIAHSYSSRKNKGTHRALISFKKMANKVSKNNTKTVWVLKCDIRKFFASIDHGILKSILAKHIHDANTLNLLNVIIDSFQTSPVIARNGAKRNNEAISGIANTHNKNQDCFAGARKDNSKGLPLGNLTSQLLVNIYMNEFDQWVKHTLKAKYKVNSDAGGREGALGYYIRYADDFVFLHTDKEILENYLKDIHIFLDTELKLKLHPQKVSLTTLASGVDFLGWVHFGEHRTLRTVTKRRMFKNLKQKEYAEESLQSYLGMLKHGNGYNLSLEIQKAKGILEL